MKTKTIYLIVMLILVVMPAFPQEDKNPVAENDFAEALALETIEIPILENDYAYENHPFEIFLVFGGNHGTLDNTDSTIIYTPELAFSGVDSVLYNIKDLENNLVSELAKVYIQVTNHGFAMLDINEISCRINSFGMQYWDLGLNSIYGYEVPKGSGKKTVFNEAAWIGGFDEAGHLHFAGERYRQVGQDFFQGPVMDSAAYSSAMDVAWNKVWKLTSGEIAYHRQHWQDEGYEPIENIGTWPGNGNTDLGQANKLAPYYDWNNNSFYDPENGDFPLIKGDMAIYLVINDDRDIHTESGGEKMGMEVHEMYYAYDQPDDSALAYATFCDRKFINRSARNYTDVMVGTFLDFDIGFFMDDFVCCDTILQSAIIYNGNDVDGDGGLDEYGEHPPAQSFTCLNYDMDGFYYFFSWGQPDQMLDPQDDFEYYNYLNGLWKDSTNFTYGGNGFGGTEPVSHIFAGDPVSGTGWTEMDSPSGPGDRRGLIVSGPYTFLSGDTIHLENALVFARDHTGDNISSVALLKTRIQEVRDFYQNSLGVGDLQTDFGEIRIFPNPCKDFINLKIPEMPNAEVLEFTIIDLLGNNVQSGKVDQFATTKINLVSFKPGIYFIRISGKDSQVTKKIIVQSS